MPEDGKEERSTSSGRRSRGSCRSAQAAGSALEREAAADRRAGRDALDLSRGPHEIDDPVEEQVVDVDVLDRRLEPRARRPR